MKISIKKYIPFFIALACALILFVLSVSIYAKKAYGKKYVFIFPSVDEGKYLLETRYLKENPNKSFLNYFADELVLGSGLERTKYLFTPGTKVISCFEREGVAYIDLTSDIIYMGHNVINVREGIELLKTNIIHNFGDIKDVQVFVEGKYAYEIEKNIF